MSRDRSTRRPRVLAVASGGGHWVQLLRLRPAFADADVTWVTVRESYRADLEPGDRLVVVPDATRWDRLKLIALAMKLLWLMVRVRPDAVVSTGAAPGFFALRLGALFGARTCWIDSIANVEEVSLSGRKVGPHVDLFLTQWSHLANDDDSSDGGPRYRGAVL